MTILVPLSGGLDSSWVLWHLLTTRKHPIAVFHLNLINVNQRQIPEEQAADNVVKWCEENVRLVKWYKKATLDMGEIAGWMDGPVQAAPVIASMMDDLTCWTIATGRNIDEKREQDPNLENVSLLGFMAVATETWNHICVKCGGNGIGRAGKELKFIEPAVNANITKAGMEKQMPNALVEMTWSCHRPIKYTAGDTGAVTYEPCKTCKSCILRAGGNPGPCNNCLDK